MGFMTTVSNFFSGGGPFMYVILTCGVLILAIILERVFIIHRASAINTSKLLTDLVAMVKRGDLTGAQKACHGIKAPVAEVAYAMVSSGHRDEERLQAAADGAATLALPKLTMRLPHLNTLANVATLLGLLGTIFGLTTAFSAVGAADPAQRSAFLAAGISQALSTTAFGLIVAVPALVMHGMLVGRVEGVVSQVDEVTVRLIRTMSRAAAPGTATSSSQAASGSAAQGKPATPPRRVA